MKKKINYTKLCIIFGLCLLTLNCSFRPKSECELLETDGKTILGMEVVAIDKTNPALGGNPESKNNQNLRACGYVSKNPTERGYLYWVQGKAEDAEEAKMRFEMAGKKPSEPINYSTELLPKIGEEAKLNRYETKDSKNLAIAVRKGKNVFLITVSKPLASEMPIEEVKLLAKRIADNTND